MPKILLDRSIAPSFVIPEKFDFQKVNYHTFGNGIKVHSLNAGKQPIIKLEFSFVAGSSQDGASYQSFFTSKLLDQGTKWKNNESIAEFIAFRGAHLEIISGNEKIIVVAYTLVKHLESICELLHEILNHSQFEVANLDRIKNIEKQNLEIRETKTAHLAKNKFVQNMFPNHFYGVSLSIPLIDAIELQQLKSFYTTYLAQATFDLFVSGAIDDKSLATIENTFGKDAVKSNKSVEKPFSSPKLGLVELSKEGSLQASIRYGFPTIGKEHPDYAFLSIVNEIFGGYFGSRLMTNIREDKGYSYGIGSTILQLKNTSYFQISTDVKAENAHDTLSEIKIEIDKMCQDFISEKELTKVKNYIVGNFANSLNTPFELMDKFRSVNILGMDYSFYDNYFDAIKATSPADIIDISQKYLSQEAVIVVCG